MALEMLRSRIAGKELFARAAEYDSAGNKIDESIDAINEKIPASASASNQLVTTSDMSTIREIPSSTAADSGKVLSVDFNGNPWWTNPPEGVYVLNCSEVNNLTDIDLNRAKTQPTYIRIDEGYGDVTISVPYSEGDNPSTYDIVLKVGTILRLSSIPAGNSEFIFTTVYNAAFNAGSMGSHGTFFPVLYIRSNNGYLYKTFNVSGEFSNGSLQMGMPTAFTKFYRTSRGNGSAASDRNSLEVQFQWNGNIRKQCLLPGEVSTHNFANDETPEEIQFMGWGATSSRAGYKTINEVPSSTASDSGKVLSVNSDGTTGWTTIPSSPYVLVDRSVAGWYSTIPAIVAAGKIPMFYDQYTYEGVPRNILYMYQYTDTSSNYVFMGTGVKIPDFTPSPKFFYVTYTLDTSTGSGSVTGCDANGIGEETINSTARLSGDTLSIDNNRAYKITISTILAKSNLIIKIEDVATADFAANVSIELTPTTDMTLTLKKWNTTLKYSVAAGNKLIAGKTYQVTAFGGCWTMAEFQLPA